MGARRVEGRGMGREEEEEEEESGGEQVKERERAGG